MLGRMGGNPGGWGGGGWGVGIVSPPPHDLEGGGHNIHDLGVNLGSQKRNFFFFFFFGGGGGVLFFACLRACKRGKVGDVQGYPYRMSVPPPPPPPIWGGIYAHAGAYGENIFLPKSHHQLVKNLEGINWILNWWFSCLTCFVLYFNSFVLFALFCSFLVY